jgi:peroxiredoxin
MNLEKQLKDLRKQSFEQMPQHLAKNIEKGIEETKKSKIAEKALNVGDKIPLFELPDINGKMKNIKDIFTSDYLIINFYRGGWCPFCNLELRAYEAIKDKLSELGATIVSISPEVPDNNLQTSKDNVLTFDVLSDDNAKVMKEFGIVFKLNDEVKKTYDEFGIDLSKLNGNENNELPVPGVFLINKNYEIIFRHLEEDYTKRFESSKILDILKKYKG